MKNDWEYKKIKDVCTKGSSNLQQNKIVELTGDYPVFGASGFVQNIDTYQQEKPYIGIVKDGSGVGRVNTYPAKSSLLGTMQYIIPNNNINLGYIAYCLQSLKLSKFASGAAIPHIYFRDYGETYIPVPPLPVQEDICSLLDNLNLVIEKKKQQIEELDNLAQSLFYDMFGDPLSNEKGWEIRKYGKEFKIGAGGTPSKSVSEYWENGTIPWIGSNMCQNRIIYQTDGKYITQEGLTHSSAKMLEKGTVIVALVGATIGKVGLLETETSTNQNVAYINVNENPSFNSYFVYYQLQKLYELFMAIGNGDFKMANQGFIKDLPIITPPLPLQQAFAEKVEAIERQKELINQSIKDVQTLFDAKMDYYFGD